MRVSAGHCSVCAVENKSSAACSREREGCRLCDLPDGSWAHVRELRGGRHLRSRLCALGFTPGAAIMVRGRGEAGCCVEVRDTCIVLDRESADNIVCDKEENDV